MRLATWNVNSVVARLPRLVDWLAASKPDVLCLQETKIADAAFPRAEVEALGYEVALHGDGRWNGVAMISRVGLLDVVRGFDGEPGFPDPEARAMSATCGGLRVWTLYVPNGRSLDSDHYPYKLRWLEALRTSLVASKPTSPPLVLCGDFNIAPTDDDVWDPAQFIGLNACEHPGARGPGGADRLGLVTCNRERSKGVPSRTGTTAAGISTRGWGCASTFSCSTRRQCDRQGRLHRP